jgi:hypothetical protein
MKALLKNIFHPTNDHLSLSAVHLSVTEEMAKDIKAMNFGYSNNLSYDSSHHAGYPHFLRLEFQWQQPVTNIAELIDT